MRNEQAKGVWMDIGRPITHHRSKLELTYNVSACNRGHPIWDRRTRSKHRGPVRIRPVIDQWSRFHFEPLFRIDRTITDRWLRSNARTGITCVRSQSSARRSMVQTGLALFCHQDPSDFHLMFQLTTRKVMQPSNLRRQRPIQRCKQSLLPMDGQGRRCPASAVAGSPERTNQVPQGLIPYPGSDGMGVRSWRTQPGERRTNGKHEDDRLRTGGSSARLNHGT